MHEKHGIIPKERGVMQCERSRHVLESSKVRNGRMPLYLLSTQHTRDYKHKHNALPLNSKTALSTCSRKMDRPHVNKAPTDLTGILNTPPQEVLTETPSLTNTSKLPQLRALDSHKLLNNAEKQRAPPIPSTGMDQAQNVANKPANRSYCVQHRTIINMHNSRQTCITRTAPCKHVTV